jgi:hypothetical protein
MAVAIADPIVWDRIIYVGTDHVWTCRRITIDDVPIIPDSAWAQVRNKHYGVLWATLDVVIDPIEGWLTFRLPKETTIADPDWRGRKTGVWDVEVEYAGEILRWIEGAITVSQEVTL